MGATEGGNCMKIAVTTCLSIYVRPEDRETVEKAIARARGLGLSQSTLVVSLLKDWLREQEKEGRENDDCERAQTV